MSITSTITGIVLVVFAASAVSLAQTDGQGIDEKKGLVGSVAQKLGISEVTAEAGTAAVLSFAKTRLGDEEFGLLGKALPEVDGILQKASGLEIQSLAGVTERLQALGMEGGMVKGFVPAVIDYVQETTGVSKAKLLRKAMSLRGES